ncbi:MAG TPA: DNRLRE domain-containing protein, partial [Anaerolineales bacterium]|nr:DNRLRE domain-containing protein [Anaerolineales bacterium]
VKLKLYANSSSSAGINVYGVSNISWVETTITYSNAPAVGSQGGSIGSFTGGTWITVDITPLITGNGTFSLAIKGVNGTAISMASRESGANAPQLIVTTR